MRKPSDMFRKYITITEYQPGDMEITQKIALKYNSELDRTRKGEPTIHNVRCSTQRAHKHLFDLLRANSWQWFVTLTFSDAKGDRLDDDATRKKFKRWRADMRARFPNMIYLAVPEYHKKGGIHFHVVVGGVSAEDLQLEDSGRVYHFGKAWEREDFIAQGFAFVPKKGEGQTIYNLNAWKYGHSTVTQIWCPEAIKHYVSKYITKVSLDPRFYNKKRFFTSQNIDKPLVLKSSTSIYNNPLSVGYEEITYRCRDTKYTRFSIPSDRQADILSEALKEGFIEI